MHAKETSPPAAAGDHGGAATRGSQRRRNWNRRSKGQREPKFKGKCANLKESMYNVVTGKDTFAKTTCEIAEYVGREFDDAGEFRTNRHGDHRSPYTVLAPAHKMLGISCGQDRVTN